MTEEEDNVTEEEENVTEEEEDSTTSKSSPVKESTSEDDMGIDPEEGEEVSAPLTDGSPYKAGYRSCLVREMVKECP